MNDEQSKLMLEFLSKMVKELELIEALLDKPVDARITQMINDDEERRKEAIEKAFKRHTIN